ncbi:MAG: hypothetical protein GYA60_09390, partial [Candidatus Methanofastidiosa archaeon]|nr:hypothetical protein [Candidatus Methanofastidiosa archaeon]
MEKIEKGKTKIVATIGPASEGEDMIRSLIVKGVDVVRLNTKHNEPEWHISTIKKVRKISESMHRRVGILLDLQGPEIRVENFNKSDIDVKRGSDYYIVLGIPQNNDEFGIPFIEVIDHLEEGQELSINDGAVSFKVQQRIGDKIRITALNSYLLG